MVGEFLSKDASGTDHTRSSLAGMIHKVGVLTRDNQWQVPFAYKMYKSKGEDDWEHATEFKKTFSVDVKVKFLGLWYVNAVHIVFVASFDVYVGIRSVPWVLYPKNCRSLALTTASATFDTPSLSMNVAPNSNQTYTTGPARKMPNEELAKTTRIASPLSPTRTATALRRITHPMNAPSPTTWKNPTRGRTHT